MSIANYFNKLLERMFCFRYSGNLALNHQWREPGEVLDDLWIKSVQLFMFRSQALLLRIGCVCFLVLLPLLLFLLHEAFIFFDTRGILGWPRTLKRNVGLLLRLPLPSLITNDVSAISWMCLSFIHQRWQATMTVHFWSQLIVTQQ